MQDREGHEDNATPAFAVVKPSTPEATDTENLLPRNAGGVHPFSGTPPCALSCPEVSFFVVFAKGVGDPIGGSLVGSATRDPTTPGGGFCALSIAPILGFILA